MIELYVCFDVLLITIHLHTKNEYYIYIALYLKSVFPAKQDKDNQCLSNRISKCSLIDVL